MRQIVEDRIRALVADGADLSDLEFSTPTSVEELPNLTDEELLDIYVDLIAFNG